MSNRSPLETMDFVMALDPVADCFAGTVNSDVFEVQGEGAFFIVYTGVGTTGTSTLTVDACSTAGAAATTAVAFIYRVMTTAGTWGAATKATSSGFATTAGSSDMYLIDVPAGNVGATGYGYVRLTATEVANDPVIGCIIGSVYGLRYAPQPSSLID